MIQKVLNISKIVYDFPFNLESPMFDLFYV